MVAELAWQLMEAIAERIPLVDALIAATARAADLGFKKATLGSTEKARMSGPRMSRSDLVGSAATMSAFIMDTASAYRI